MKKRSPIFKLSMVDSIGDLILIFGLNLSIGSPYYQGGCIWMNFRLLKYFIWDDIHERKHSQNIPLHKVSVQGRMIRAPPENTQRSLSGVGVYIPLLPLHLPLFLSPTNLASKTLNPPLLSILELDSCKETPRDWVEVRFEVWFESTPWASTCSSQEAFKAILICRFTFVTFGALLLDG